MGATCGTGVAAGLTGAFTATKVIQAQLFGISALDPLAYVVAVLTLLALAALASYARAPSCERRSNARAQGGLIPR